MELTARAKQELVFIFDKFDRNSFDENDVEKLLLHFRDQFKDQKLIWEFASFIAHPNHRDQGVFHQALDVFHAKMTYIRNEDATPLNIGKIDTRLYNTLIIGSIETNHESDLKKEFRLSRDQCLKLVRKSYERKGNYYHLKLDENTEKVISIIELVVSTLNNKPIINNDKILSEFLRCLKLISRVLPKKINPKGIIRTYGHDILLCMMALCHSAKFKLIEGGTGSCELRLVQNQEKIEKGIIAWNLELMSIMKMKDNSNLMWSLMVLDHKIDQYIPELENLNLYSSKYILPHFNAIRNSQGKIVLGTPQ